MKDGSEKDVTARRAAAIREWLTLRLSEAIGVDPAQIDPRLPFATFGLSSLAAYTLTGELAEWIGRDLPATLLWEYPTISTLSEHLAEEMGGEARDLVCSPPPITGANEPEED
jgi:acyl carrier protein